MTNEILHGDCLEVLKERVAGSVNLVYLDPPFNSGRSYSITVEDSMAQEVAYTDTWAWTRKTAEDFSAFTDTKLGTGKAVADFLSHLHKNVGETSTLAYLVMLAPRLVELHRVLSPKGTLWVHVDPTMSHYVKVVLDLIFSSPGGFLSEVIWQRTSAHNKAKRPGPIHDTLLVYTKSDQYTWNPQYHSYREGYLDKYDGVDQDGRKWVKENLCGPGIRNGTSGQPWRGYDPSKHGTKGRNWAIPSTLVEEYTSRTNQKLTEVSSPEKLEALFKADLIVLSDKVDGAPMYKKYIDKMKGIPIQDVWTDISPIRAGAKENEDFEGQKPLALLDRIIKVSSNEGDLILDPFSGSGTTAVAAQRTHRRWVCIELTPQASRLARNRLDKEFGEGCYTEHNDWPADLAAAEALADSDDYKFQCWAVRQVNGMPSRVGGNVVDGTLLLNGFADNRSRAGIIEVKGGGTGPGDIRDFCTQLRRKDATVGLFLAFRKNITSGMREEARLEGTFNSGFQDDPNTYDKIQLIAIDDFFDRRLIHGGVRVPGFIPKPDYSQTKAALTRREQEHYLEMSYALEALGEEL